MYVLIASFLFLASLTGCGEPMAPIPTTEQQINDEVILVSVHRLDVYQGCPDKKGEISTTCLASIMWDTRREEVLSEPCGDSCPEWYADTNKFLMYELRNPAKLERLYKTLEPTLVKTITDSDSAPMVRKYIKDVVVPTFAKNVNDELRFAYFAEASSWNVSRKKTDDQNLKNNRLLDLETKRHAFGILAQRNRFPNVYLLQWRLRREVEGGPQLVKAYADIAERLSGKLEMARADELLEEVRKEIETQPR